MADFYFLEEKNAIKLLSVIHGALYHTQAQLNHHPYFLDHPTLLHVLHVHNGPNCR